MNWLYFVAVLLGSAVGTILYRFIKDKYLQHKYRWRCKEEGCEFKLSCSDAKVMESLIAGHLTRHPRSNWPE